MPLNNDELNRQAPVCARVQLTLLTAELNELRGAGDSEVAAHVRECLRCRAAAQRILQGNLLLAARLESALTAKKRAGSAWPLWFALPIAAMLAGLVVLHERNVQLEFTPNDPNGFQFPGWGDPQLGGNYHEAITGLHRNPIHVEGTFRLFQASRVGVLNDAN